MAKRPTGGQKRPSGRHKLPGGGKKKPAGGRKRPTSEQKPPTEKPHSRQKKTASRVVKLPGKKKGKKKRRPSEPVEGRWTRKQSIAVWRQIDEFIKNGTEPTIPVLKNMKAKNPEDFERIVENRRKLREEAKVYVSGPWKPSEDSALYRLIMKKPKMARKLLRQVLTEKMREEMGEKFDQPLDKKEFLPQPKKSGPVRESKRGRYWVERLMRVLNYKLDEFRAKELKKKPKGE